MNNNLNKAKSVKNDEFYTQLADIEKELQLGAESPLFQVWDGQRVYIKTIEKCVYFG